VCEVTNPEKSSCSHPHLANSVLESVYMVCKLPVTILSTTRVYVHIVHWQPVCCRQSTKFASLLGDYFRVCL